MKEKKEVINLNTYERVKIKRHVDVHCYPHISTDCKLVYVERGSVSLFIDKKSYSLKKGQVFFIDKGILHFVQVKPETALRSVMFDRDLVEDVTPIGKLKSPLLTSDYDFLDIYSKIESELNDRRMGFESVVNCLVIEAVAKIFRSEEISASFRINESETALIKLLDTINEEFKTISFSESARAMDMSDAYFSRLFHQVTGITFSQYVNFVRINKAIALLKQPKPPAMSEVAILAGFTTIRNFNRAFKELTGHTPKRMPKSFSFENL